MGSPVGQVYLNAFFNFLPSLDQWKSLVLGCTHQGFYYILPEMMAVLAHILAHLTFYIYLFHVP